MTKGEILELLPSLYCLIIIMAAIYNVKGDNVTMLEDFDQKSGDIMRATVAEAMKKRWAGRLL